VLAASGTLLTVRIPADAVSGDITVTVGGASATIYWAP
jgi:hypothetical protein